MNLQSIPFLNSILIKPQQVVSEFWSDRKRILGENVNLFCWKRTSDDRVNNYLEKLSKKDLPAIKYSVTDSNLQDKLNEARVLWDQKYNSGGDSFWKDVFQLAKDFLDFSIDGKATIHMNLIDDNACTKFHTDAYELRLFTTYYGKGTEWLPEQATNRKALGRSNDLIVKDTAKIQRMKAFEVGILKGEPRHKKNSLPGIVHRSPSIEKMGEKRIILRIDI